MESQRELDQYGLGMTILFDARNKDPNDVYLHSVTSDQLIKQH